jgi:hypothetical protein
MLLFVVLLALAAAVLVGKLLRPVLTGVAIALVGLAVWLFWSPQTAIPALTPVVRPAAQAVQRHAEADLHLYGRWALRWQAHP